MMVTMMMKAKLQPSLYICRMQWRSSGLNNGEVKLNTHSRLKAATKLTGESDRCLTLIQMLVGSCGHSGEGAIQLLRLALSKGPNWVGVFFLLITWGRKYPVSETSCFLFSRILNHKKCSKLSNPVCYTPLSEPFRIY
jgi:hypothetical protein